MSQNGNASELVTLTIDGKEVKAPKGTNLIQAAKSVGIEIPFYCYHPHLSVPGNCRICQVEVEGAPKLMIGCHTVVQDGMVVRTHETSERVKNTQAATMEFLLINHPLDCTVCDQAGHCKLQDYHYEYNARPSRFVEEKVHKVKAEPLGPTVMLDGERCIACTRCVRFCDEITKTSELGLLNRGDRFVIAISEDRELNNPLSGTVVDLCPVGALTHRKWRFNTRIWYANQTDSICPGCSTGCNVKVYERDGQIVQVKARLNAKVNKEWLCDEGRYGFQRFLPQTRVTQPIVDGESASWETVLKKASGLKSGKTLVLLAPDLLVENYFLLQKLFEKHLADFRVSLCYQERELSELQKILVSPDYAANLRGAEFVGLVSGDLAADYQRALSELEEGSFQNLLVVGDRALSEPSEKQVQAISQCALSVGLLTDSSNPMGEVLQVVLPARSILEQSGLLINRDLRLQYGDKVVDAPRGTEATWKILNRIAQEMGGTLIDATSDRDVTIAYLFAEARLRGLRIATIKGEGVCLKSYRPSEKDPTPSTGIGAGSAV